MKKPDRIMYYLIIFGFELFLVLAAFIITLFTKKPFASLFTSSAPLPAFIIITAAGASLAVLTTLTIAKLPVFKKVYAIFESLIRTYEPSFIDILALSALAGICEETLFRAVLQPMWGIWITSFIFIFLHGYLNPLDWRMSIFGAIMYCISLALGFVFIKYGLIPAMVFHFIYDFAALLALRVFVPNPESPIPN